MATKQNVALAASILGLGLTIVRELRQQRNETMRKEKHAMAKERHERLSKK